MKKVAIITPGTFPVPATQGGAVESLVQSLIFENEKENKIDLTVFSIYEKEANKKSEEIKKTNISFVKIPMIVMLFNNLMYFFFSKILKKKKTMSYRYILQRLYFIWIVSKRIKKDNYDKIILENHSTLYLCLKLFGNYKKYKGKYIYHMHNKLSGFYGCEKEIENTELVIGVSKYILSEYKKIVPQYNSNVQFVVLRNKVNSKFSYKNKVSDHFITSFKNKKNIPVNDRIVLFSGRLNKEKGIDQLLRAWNKANLTDATLVIVGAYYFNSKVKDSSFDKELDNLLRKSKKVIFTGFIDYSLMPNIYKMADLVILPSMWEDPAPLTVIETLTAARPLITTNSGGIPEYVKDTGTIVLNKEDKKFADNLSKKMKEILYNSQELNKMMKKSMIITKNWNNKQFYNDFINIIN